MCCSTTGLTNCLASVNSYTFHVQAIYHYRFISIAIKATKKPQLSIDSVCSNVAYCLLLNINTEPDISLNTSHRKMLSSLHHQNNQTAISAKEKKNVVHRRNTLYKTYYPNLKN